MNAALEAAMTTVPRLLIADWMMMFASENTPLWMPAGRPMRRMRFRIPRSMRSRCGSTCTSRAVVRRRK